MLGESSSSVFSAQVYTDPIKNIPCPFAPDGFIETGIHAHIWGPHLLHGTFLAFFDFLRIMLLETHSTDALVNQVLSSQVTISSMAEQLFLLATPLCGRHSARPK